MPFRDDLRPVPEAIDPLARYVALSEAFEAKTGFFGDRVPGRLAAVSLVLTPGEPAGLVARVNSYASQLTEGLPWFSQLDRSFRISIAATLLKHGDEPAAFLAESERAKALFRKVGMRRSESYEVLALLAARISTQLAPLSLELAQRIQAVYEAMRTHHWWLTGPEDLPACALLACRPGEPSEFGRKATDIYSALERRAGLWRGDPLQTASNLLSLGGLEPDELAQRFQNIAQGLKEAGFRIGQGDYDDVAVLCFLAQPVDRIVDTIRTYTHRIRGLIGLLERGMAMSLATNLAFARMVYGDPELGALADAKCLLDMQAIVIARQAS